MWKLSSDVSTAATGVTYPICKTPITIWPIQWGKAIRSQGSQKFKPQEYFEYFKDWTLSLTCLRTFSRTGRRINWAKGYVLQRYQHSTSFTLIGLWFGIFINMSDTVNFIVVPSTFGGCPDPGANHFYGNVGLRITESPFLHLGKG